MPIKKSLSVLVALFLVLFTTAQDNAQYNLNAREFAAAIQVKPSPVVIDVRTLEEFESGHIERALNYDWRGKQFLNQIEGLDRKQAVYVYCMSGGRSAAAAQKMREEGFEKVYELKGGILQWRSESLPEVAGKPASKGMTQEEFEKLLDNPKTVLVDFYAEWCGPCKKMKPYLDAISRDMADKVEVIRIDVDKNRSLAKFMRIDAIPVLQVYRDKKMTWTETGFVEKSEVLKHLK
jgi:thioredoxin 1